MFGLFIFFLTIFLMSFIGEAEVKEVEVTAAIEVCVSHGGLTKLNAAYVFNKTEITALCRDGVSITLPKTANPK